MEDPDLERARPIPPSWTDASGFVKYFQYLRIFGAKFFGRARIFFPSLYGKIFRYFVNFIDKIFDGIGTAISRERKFFLSRFFFFFFFFVETDSFAN